MDWEIFNGVAIAITIIIIFLVFFILYIDYKDNKRREKLREYGFAIEKIGED